LKNKQEKQKNNLIPKNQVVATEFKAQVIQEIALVNQRIAFNVEIHAGIFLFYACMFT